MSNSVQPHRRQPIRLPRPWDSPGKNTGVGCHFPLQCMKMKSESEVTQSCLTPSNPMDCSPPASSVHGIFQARVLERGAIAFSYATFKVFATLKKSLTYEADRLDRSLKLTHSILIVLCICIFIPLFVIVYCIPRQKCSEIIDRFSVGRKIDKPKHIHISECTGEEGSWRSRT